MIFGDAVWKDTLRVERAALQGCTVDPFDSGTLNKQPVSSPAVSATIKPAIGG